MVKQSWKTVKCTPGFFKQDPQQLEAANTPPQGITGSRPRAEVGPSCPRAPRPCVEVLTGRSCRVSSAFWIPEDLACGAQLTRRDCPSQKEPTLKKTNDSPGNPPLMWKPTSPEPTRTIPSSALTSWPVPGKRVTVPKTTVVAQMHQCRPCLARLAFFPKSTSLL